MVKGKDKKIINELRVNARCNLTDISKNTDVPISTIHDRMKILNMHFDKHSTLLNFSSLGLIQANILVRIPKEERIEFSEYLKRIPCVNSAYRIDKLYDFLIEGIFSEIEDLHKFLDEMESQFEIRTKLVCHVISTVEKEKFML